MSTERQVLQFFGRRLRMARCARFLSQADFGHLAGLRQETVSNYEQGKSSPHLANVLRMAQVLDVDISYFFPVQQHPEAEMREALALIPSLPLYAQHYLVHFVSHVALCEQRRRFLMEQVLALPDDHSKRRAIVERDLQVIEEQASNIPLDVLVSFSAAILMSLELEAMDDATHQLLQRLNGQGQRLISLLRQHLHYQARYGAPK